MKNDFGEGPVWKVVLSQAFPLMIAQIVHLLYNIVDRIYIGHLPENGSLALTGIGLIFPLTTLVGAFTNLFSTGGAPLFAISRGAKDENRAQQILDHVFLSLLWSSLILFVVCYVFRRNILFLFGASENSYAFANDYLKIYLFGTTAAMLSTGLNAFINAQGFPKIGMYTIIVGAISNIILDPILIFYFEMGVRGAALATVFSQMISCLYVLRFFHSDASLYRLRFSGAKLDLGILKDIVSLGVTGFIMQGTNSLVSIACNVTLRAYGGDLHVAVMTVVNSVREILLLPALSICQGSQPVLSYNYGARKYSRIRQGIRFMSYLSAAYTAVAWIAVLLFPHLLMRIFTENAEMIQTGSHALHLYFFGFIFMALQSSGQSTFTSLKCTKRAIFFSLLRKVVIVVPLTILLPMLGFGSDGVFLAEPISNFIGGIACFATMWFTVIRRLPADGEEALI